jgi:hypothetical protein
MIRRRAGLAAAVLTLAGSWMHPARAAETGAAEVVPAAVAAAPQLDPPTPASTAAARQLDGPEFAAAEDAAPATARETPPRQSQLPLSLAPANQAGVTQRRVGAVVLGAGIFALAGAGAMAISVAGNRENDASYCGGDPQCTDPLGLLARSRASDGAAVGYVLAAGAVALLTTGVLLLVTAPSRRAVTSTSVFHAATAAGFRF